MKKSLLTLMLLWCALGFSQVINQVVSWPNNNWLLTGSYTATGLSSNPTTTGATFTYSDDNSGQASLSDVINVESPVLDLTAAYAAGEGQITIAGTAIWSTYTAVDALTIQYWNADASAWVNAYTYVPVPDPLYLNFYTTCSNTTTYTTTINTTNFTPNMLANFKYRFAYDDGGSWEMGFCVNPPTVTSASGCAVPTLGNASNIMDVSADLGWTENGSANSWRVEIVTSGTTPTRTGVNAFANPYAAAGLTANTTYDFYVSSTCGVTNSTWAGPFTFTTIGTCSDPSTLAAANITDMTADLSWTENGTATLWDIELLTSGTTPTGTATQTGVANPYMATGLTASTAYDFYVRADCGAGSTSNWVGPFTFTTTATPPACADPSTLAAANITDMTADLSWTENGTATAWDIELLTSGTAPTGTATQTGVANPYMATGLTASTAYDFYVRADCGSGSTSNWVGPYTFTTTATPVCADPSTLDATNITDMTAELSWMENGTATAWDIELLTSGTAPTGTATQTGVANPYMATGLTASTAYDYYVRADCGSGSTSNWVGPFTFTTTATPPVCADPSNLDAINITDIKADLSWMENGTATLWDIELLTSGTAPTGTATQTGVSNPYLASGLTASTAYDFYVRADCGSGSTSNWVGPFTFTTTATPVCADPSTLDATNITDMTADLSWMENGTATAWDIELLTSGTAPTGTATQTGVANPYMATGLTASTAYDFYVRADCGSGSTSNWVGPFTFTTTATPPTCVDPSTLAAANITDMTADLSWTENGTATAWDIELLTSGTTPTGTATQTGVANPYLATGLTASTAYDFYVRADCGSGSTSNWVGPFTFTTTATPTCADPSNLTAANVFDKEADLSWTENGTATAWDIELVTAGTAPTGTPSNAGVTNPFTVTNMTPGINYEYYVRADCGSGLTSNWVGPFNFTTTAGIETLENVVFALSPNPTSGTIQVAIQSPSKEVRVLVQSIDGKKINEFTTKQTSFTVSLENENNGVYLITLETADGQTTKRIVKQ